MKYVILFAGLLFMNPIRAFAEIHTETVEYYHGDQAFEGYLAYENFIQTKQPGVIVVHEWKGLGSYAKKRAEQLAELGYVALAIDMYGKGIRPQTNEEAAKQAKIYKSDRKLMRSRADAGFQVLANHSLVDPNRIAAIGYCFGGTTVLEMARFQPANSQSPYLKGIVSFHGGLDFPDPAPPSPETKMLVLHGANDPLVPPDQVWAFQEEMKKAGVDLQFIAYDGAVHSFTNPDSGDDPTKGVAYNAKADKESWETMKAFLNKVFEGQV